MHEAAPRHRYSLPAYVGAGGVATAAHYAVTIVAVEMFGVAPIAASAAQALTTILLIPPGYVIHRRWVFR
jgi:putative flippase GtrA